MVTGRVGEPVSLGVTTGIGMTVMGTEGGDRADGMGGGRDSMWSSSALETLLMWIVEFTLGWLCSFRCCRRSFSFSSSVGKTQPLIQPIPSIHTYTKMQQQPFELSKSVSTNSTDRFWEYVKGNKPGSFLERSGRRPCLACYAVPAQ